MGSAVTIRPQPGDALILVDVQTDFLPDGNLGVPHGDEVVPVLNRYAEIFQANKLPVFATRDWHPPNHCSFADQGGPWPPHCIANTPGAAFAPNLRLPPQSVVVSKAERVEQDAYSGFEGTDLDTRLKRAGVRRVFVGGLATDYCVLNTVRDARKLGYEVFLLTDGSRAVNVQPDDGRKAEEEMRGLGAEPIELRQLAA